MRERAFDCVVLDLRMPDISVSSCSRKFSRSEVADTPIVVFTAANQRGERKAAQKAKRIVLKGVRSPSACSMRPRCFCTA